MSFKQFLGYAAAKETPEFKNINYNIAYAYFKQKEYEQAGNYFQSYIDANKDDKVRLNDAYLRLGDSRFVTSKYWPAMDAYNKAIEMKGIDADYAAFQQALRYGFVSRNDRKIEDFTKFLQNFKSSQYRDDALFGHSARVLKAELDGHPLLVLDAPTLRLITSADKRLAAISNVRAFESTSW